MKIFLALLLFSSFGRAAQLVIPTTCYATTEFSVVATTTSVLIVSTSSRDINCWIVQNQDASNPIYINLNASTNTRGHEIQAGSIYQMYVNPTTKMYLRSGTGNIVTDVLMGKTTPQ